MAKVGARGAHKIGQVTVETTNSRFVFCLRSDGKVLRRLAGFYNDSGEYTAHPTGYKVWASLKPAEGSERFTFSDVERLAEILRKRRVGTVSAVGR